jgi:hypothetical protein
MSLDITGWNSQSPEGNPESYSNRGLFIAVNATAGSTTSPMECAVKSDFQIAGQYEARYPSPKYSSAASPR